MSNFWSIELIMIDHKLKYLAPAAAFTTLFLVGCGDEDEVYQTITEELK